MDPAARSPASARAWWLPWLRRHAVLLSLVLLTAVLEGAIWLRSPVIAPDGIHFIAMAHDFDRDLLAALRAYDQHPGYPALVWAVRRTLCAGWGAEEAWIFAARLASAACGVAGVVVVWLLARQIASRAVAHWSALVYAVLPVFRQNAADALSDAPHLLLYLTGVLLVAWAVARRSPALCCAAGVASGLAFLIRPEGLSVALVAGLMALAWPSWRREWGWRRSLGAAAALAAGAALVVAPYVLASGKFSGKITSKTGWLAPTAVIETPVVAARTTQAVRRAAAPRSRRPDGAPRAVRRSRPPRVPPRPQAPPRPAVPRLTPIPHAAPIASMSWPRALGEALALFGERMGESLRWILLVPLAAGLIAATRFGDPPTRWFLWALALFHMGLLLLLYCVAGYIDRRHALPLVALLLPTIAAGLVALYDGALQLALVRRHRRVFAACAFLALAALLLPRTLRPLHTTHCHTLAAARVLDELAAPGDTVVSNSRHVIYYATLRGKLAGGVRLYAGSSEAGPTQPGGHRFCVLELGGEQFHPAWREEIAADFVPVAMIPGDAALDQNDIVICQRRSPVASAAGPPRRR